MIERDYDKEIGELGKKIHDLINDFDESLLYDLAFLCGVMIGTMQCMQEEIALHRKSLGHEENEQR